MNLAKILFFLICTSLVCCEYKSDAIKATINVNKDYKLVMDDLGLLVEKFDSTVVDENMYNHNNTIYKPGSKFKYGFEHITSNGESKYFGVEGDSGNWEFVNAATADSSAFSSFFMEVANGNPMSKYVPDYNQTVLMYKMGEDRTYSMTGAIENEGNVWIHPIRDHYFAILQINPYPYIKAPYKVGAEWTWMLRIGGQWSDERWKSWAGNIENECKYKIVGKRNLETDLGKIECFVIESDASSRLGKTRLIAYFNTDLGFVRLDYTNIDGSLTNIKLIGHSN